MGTEREGTMLCMRCGEHEATIHEVVIDPHGHKLEKHLCEQCATQAGVGTQQNVPISELISTFVVASPGSGERAAAATETACSACGTSFAEFRNSGLLGCPSCYAAFEQRLGPLLSRAHEGGTHHVGKIPRRALTGGRGGEGAPIERLLGDAEERSKRLTLLRKQLAEAVRGERYERAAEIKDEIERVLSLTDEDENGADA